MGKFWRTENAMRYTRYAFNGTAEEWRQFHVARCEQLGIRYSKGGLSAIEQFCSPVSPCDGCKEWARRRLGLPATKLVGEEGQQPQ